MPKKIDLNTFSDNELVNMSNKFHDYRMKNKADRTVWNTASSMIAKITEELDVREAVRKFKASYKSPTAPLYC